MSPGVEYRLCFKETEGSSQCQGSRSSCTDWGKSNSWTAPFRDDTDDRAGGCTYQWSIEERFAAGVPAQKCRVNFRETEGSSQCQGTRTGTSGWSTSPVFSPEFRDDTDNRSGGCTYQWSLECVAV